MTIRRPILFITAMLSSISLAIASEPAAIVEDVSGDAGEVQLMDLLEKGRVIKLGKDATLTLGYLSSCVREVVKGGTVTIGEEKSKVENGSLESEEVDCDGGQVIKSSTRGAEVAGAVFRQGKTGKPLPKPGWTVYSTKPLIRLSEASKQIRVVRLDKEGEKPIEIAAKSLMVDLSKSGAQLDPGGLYAITNDVKTYILKVSPLAEPDAPFLSRLIPM